MRKRSPHQYLLNHSLSEKLGLTSASSADSEAENTFLSVESARNRGLVWAQGSRRAASRLTVREGSRPRGLGWAVDQRACGCSDPGKLKRNSNCSGKATFCMKPWHMRVMSERGPRLLT